MPDSWSATDWLPAKQMKIEEAWPQSGKPFTVGEPITRTLTLRTDGLSASQLPEFAHDLPDHLKSYADKPVLKDDKQQDGVHGSRQEKIAIMPMQPGTYILPEIVIDWWNTTTEKIEQATLPARTFTVVAAAASPVATSSAPPAAPTPLQTLPTTIAQIQPQAGLVASWWQWLALLFAAAWFITLSYVWYLRRGRGVRKQESTDNRALSIKQASKAIETACKHHDAKACEQALLHLANLQYSDSSMHSLSALTQICSEALQTEVLKLEQALYASSASAWQGDALLQVFRQEGGFTIPPSELLDKANALPRLYPE